MHKNATKCNETIGKWCKNKHGASKIIDTFETYQGGPGEVEAGWRRQRSSCCSATMRFTGPLGSQADPLRTGVPQWGFMRPLGMSGPI
jgi:hypothetical protein